MNKIHSECHKATTTGHVLRHDEELQHSVGEDAIGSTKNAQKTKKFVRISTENAGEQQYF